MKTTVCVSLSPDTVRAIERIVETGDFRGTALRRRSRSEVVEVLLEYAIGQFPAWEAQRLKYRTENETLSWAARHQRPVKRKEP